MTDEYDSTRETWRRIWNEEADVARELKTLEYPRSLRIETLYLRFLQKEQPVLEAGCGLGREVIRLDGRGYRIAGIDYAEEALHRIVAYRRGYRLAAGDVHHLPFRDGAFGSCLSFGVLEHFATGPAAALRETNRVLREGGVLVLILPYPNLVWRFLRLKRKWAGEPPVRPGFYETTYTVRDLEDQLNGAGFQVVERHPIGHSFTLWGLGGLFRGGGYYETSALAEGLGAVLQRVLPWPMCFESLIVARKAYAA
jgi:SAM-dependent methyltransferase